MGTGRLDYAKAKRRAAARHGELITPAGPFRSSLQGWRTEWDGDPFPVTTTLIKAGDNTMEAKDYNGHTPDPEPGADESPAEQLLRIIADNLRLSLELAAHLGVSRADLCGRIAASTGESPAEVDARIDGALAA